jgi:hypothetical protein
MEALHREFLHRVNQLLVFTQVNNIPTINVTSD